MHYAVQVVEDHQLPPGIRWAFVCSGDDQFMFIKRSVMLAGSLVLTQVLSNAWHAWMLRSAVPALRHLPPAG